jgi:hypothetical protein
MWAKSRKQSSNVAETVKTMVSSWLTNATWESRKPSEYCVGIQSPAKSITCPRAEPNQYPTVYSFPIDMGSLFKRTGN